MAKKQKSTTLEERIEVWVDLVREVEKEGKLPVPNKVVFINECLKIYKKKGFDDVYENPFFISETWANSHWTKIINETASGNDGVFIKYIREDRYTGSWRKVNKFEYRKHTERQANDIATRIENYTYNKELADKRWKNLNLPGFEVKQFPSGS